MSVPQDIFDLISRWREKGERYDYNMLTDCFDGFFTAFVLYNLLYDMVCAHNETEYAEYTRDGQRATEVVKRYVGADAVARDAEIRNNAFAIKGLVERGAFYIREAAWDCERVEVLDSDDTERWSRGLLEIVYKIRCNTFHGQKSFQDSQRDILVPCIKILQRLNDLIIQKLAPGQRPSR